MKTYYAVHDDKTHVKVGSTEDFAARFSTTHWALVQADSEGWIAHTGSECPLPEDAKCEVKFGNGTIIIWDSAGRCWWHNTALKAYRPILAERVQEPEPAAKLTTNTIDLLGTLARAHEHAAQIPDLEAELREVLAGMGYDLVRRSPFTQQRHGAGE